MKRIELILFVLLLIHFPLFYFSNNLFDLTLFSLVELLGITFLSGTVIVGLLVLLSRAIKNYNSSIFILINIFLFFSYGSFYQFLIENGVEVRHVFLLPFFFAIFILSFRYVPKLSKKLTKVILTILFVFLITDMFTLVSELDYDATGNYWKSSHELESLNLDKFPSIIYIVPDKYPSQKALQIIFNYDNSLFLNNLKNMGFDIRNVTSNYHMSVFSIPSTLNMDYLIQADQKYSMSIEASNAILLKLLRENNYELIHINGADSYHVEKFDVNLCKTNILLRHNDFFKTSMLDFILVLSRPIYSNFIDDVTKNRICFFNELNNLENLDNKKRFVFAHVLMPHDPYFIKDENGNLELIEYESFSTEKEGFVSNIEIVNEKLISILPNLIKNNPNTIIVLMSDHGFITESEAFKNLSFDNFLAIYLPENYKLDDIKTNVNLFRSLLRNIDQSIQLIEEYHFDSSCGYEIEKIENIANFTLKC